MNRHWLSQSGSKSLLLVFGGWGLGAAPFRGLTGADDVLVVDDYTTLADNLTETTCYENVILLAYSFGVVSAAHWLAQSDFRPSRKIAVNGTLYPADETRGISPQTVAATIDEMTPESFAKFCQRAGHYDATPCIDIVAAQEELRCIVKRGAAPETVFDRIWISKRDRIIPAQAQETAWQGQGHAVRHISSGSHQPFVDGQRWQEWLI